MKNHYKKYFFINISLSLLLLMGFQNIQAQTQDQAGGITPGTSCTEKGTAGETCTSNDQSLRCVRSPSPNALPMNSCSPYPCQFVQPITGTQTVYITKLPQSINLNVDSCAPSTADAYVPYSMPASTMDYKGDIRFEFNPSAYGFGLQSDIKILPANYSFIYTKYIVHDAPNCTYSGYSAPGVSTAFTVLYGKTIDTYTSQSADATHTCASYKVTPTCMYGAGFNTAPGNYLYCYDGCTGPDGAFIPNGGSKDYYKVNQSLTCASQVETRVCTNGSLSGSATYASCNTTINGLCGDASGTAVSTAPSSSTDLCSAGNPSAVAGTGPWKWSCAGAYGGTNASCSASKNGSGCGWLPYTNFYTKADKNNFKISTKAEMFAWLLSGAPKESQACITCLDGEAMGGCDTSNVGETWQPCISNCLPPSTAWKICVCDGAPTCGAAAATPTATKPTTNLCSVGFSTAGASDTGTAWSWSCKGINGGVVSSVSCSTSKGGLSCPLPPKIISDNDANSWFWTNTKFPTSSMSDGQYTTVLFSTGCSLGLSCVGGVLTREFDSCGSASCNPSTLRIKYPYASSDCETYYHNSPTFYTPVLQALSNYSAANQSNFKNKIYIIGNGSSGVGYPGAGLLTSAQVTQALNYAANPGTMPLSASSNQAYEIKEVRLNSNVLLKVQRNINIGSTCSGVDMFQKSEYMELNVTCGMTYQWDWTNNGGSCAGADYCSENFEMPGDPLYKKCDSTTVGTTSSCCAAGKIARYTCNAH